MSYVVLDTDVASAILKGRLPDDLARPLGRQLAIIFVTVGEMTQWATLNFTSCRSSSPLPEQPLRSHESDQLVNGRPCSGEVIR